MSHEEKETLSVDVEIPDHAPRVTTELFERTKKILIERVGGRCFICNATEAEAADCKAGKWGVYAQAFHWEGAPLTQDPYRFVDDMTVNGLLLCKKHHIGKDEGIHYLPHPLWIWQRYAPDGYEISAVEVAHEFS